MPPVKTRILSQVRVGIVEHYVKCKVVSPTSLETSLMHGCLHPGKNATTRSSEISHDKSLGSNHAWRHAAFNWIVVVTTTARLWHFV